MPRPFAITAASNSVFLDKDRQGEVGFTVSNQSGHEIDGRAHLVTEEAEAQSWVALRGQTHRRFSTAGTEQYHVDIEVPSDAPSGSYEFRLDMVGEARPDEQYVEGPSVTFQVQESEPEPEPFPWTIMAAIAVLLLIVGGITAYYWFKPETTAVPDVSGLSVVQATDSLRQAGFLTWDLREEHNDSIDQHTVIGTDPAARVEASTDDSITVHVSLGPERLDGEEAKQEAEELTMQWVEAMEAEDVASMVKLARPPFFWDDEVLTSEVEVIKEAEAMTPPSEGVAVDSLVSLTIAEYKERIDPSGDRLLSEVQMSDEDLVVILFVGGEAVGFFFRRHRDSVQMIGFWD